MFILEESQLLEDNIENQDVLALYKILRANETSSCRDSFVNDILSNEKCSALTEILLDCYQSNGFSISDSASDKNKFTLEQREDACKKLNLNKNDLAALALVVSASMTQLFVIDNYLDSYTEDAFDKTYKRLPQLFHQLNEQINHKSLSKDESEVYHKTINCWLLRLIQLYWNFLSNLCNSRKLLELEFLFWKHRYLTVYLMMQLEISETVVNELRKIQEFIFDHHILNDMKDNNTQLVRFNLVELCCELVQSSLLRGSLTASRKFFDYACELSGLSIENTGVLGKRTKFQQNNIPQLVVKVSEKQDDNNVPKLSDISQSNKEKQALPKDVALEDDTLLPDIAFVSEMENGVIEPAKVDLESTNSVAAILMLTKLDILLKGEVMEESLKDEWAQAYIRTTIKVSKNWCATYKALALRSVVERKHMRKMERALLQFEELIKITTTSSHSISSNKDSNTTKMTSFYSVLPQSTWQMQLSLGNLSYDLALFKNALEMFTRIEYWEGIIRCYCALGQTVKAEKIIRQELDKQETPYLYCLLGDATDDISYYEKSWSLSEQRFARAKKSIGTYYYTRKQYAEAIENYELALSVNPSNISILSLLAYSCLEIERYERAAECYRNITYHDDGNFLAWNNLSKAYIKLNQKERAWRTLREAIKCNYDEWKIWENFMIVSIEIGALDDVVTAWHRIIDIKSSHKDDQILSMLTYSLVRKSNDKVNVEYMKVLANSLKLIARLISTSDCSPRLWICYYKLLAKEFDLLKNLKTEQTGLEKPMTKLDIDAKVSKIANCLQRATPVKLMTDSEWSCVPEKIDRVLDSYHELVDCYEFAFNLLGPRPELWRQWKNFKLSCTNIIRTLEKKGYAPPN